MGNSKWGWIMSLNILVAVNKNVENCLLATVTHIKSGSR